MTFCIVLDRMGKRGKSSVPRHMHFLRAYPDGNVHDGGRIYKIEAVQARRVVPI